MSKNEKNIWKGRENHKKPVTRREFLAQGLIEAGGLLMMPSLLDMVLRPQLSFGAPCPTAAGSSAIPLMVLDCAGGLALMHSFVPMGIDGQPLALYDRIGLGAGQPPLDRTMGAPINGRSEVANTGTTTAPVNRIYDGLLQTTSASTRANSRITTICAESQDDSSNNPLSPLQLVSLAGLTGQLITTPLGNNNSASGSGGNSRGPAGLAGAPSALRVASVTDVLNAVSIGGAIANLTATQKGAIAKAAENLSDVQARKLASMTYEEQFKTLSKCGYAKNVEFTGNLGNLVDPRLSQAMLTAYGDGTTIPTNLQGQASITYNVLMGNSGGGAIRIGGCDYHNNGRASTNAKDLEVGQAFGRMLQAAALLNKPLMVAIISDGAVNSGAGSPEFASDDGRRGTAVLAMYHPNGGPNQRRTQLGAFTSGQAVDRTFPVGANPAAVAYFITANWLNAQGRGGDFYKLPNSAEFSPGTVSTAQLDSMIAFDKKG